MIRPNLTKQKPTRFGIQNWFEELRRLVPTN